LNKNKEEIKCILAEIENELRSLELWKDKLPNVKAFQSNEPFFMDTMEFHEWLQFVLIERFRSIINERKDLPENVAIFPYAFEIYKNEKSSKMKLLKHIYALDNFFKKG
jgi:uncharacterized protein YqcC (DUF446 family)